ncbi:MAG TPA: KpsF/GutQ family sugar-phosphate isomerase [Phycisphaerae bacterium]|nr:KpsF/GutQ family sugar-phosphate isomerase [Phycisphaerae bacterium]
MDATKATINSSQLLSEARQVVRSEGAGLNQVADRLDGSIVKAMELIYLRTGPELPGAVVVSGIGKSGLAGQRISASFAGTGTPSHFLHPVEALHGDLGRVRRDDVVLLLSYGGESDELVRLLDQIKRIAAPTIAILGSRDTTIGRLTSICIELGDIQEACPLRLAPSTTLACMNAVADALVLGVMSMRNFSSEDFAAFHPAGSLGRKLLRVREVMSFKIGENLSVIPVGVSVREALSKDQTQGRRAGAMLLVDQGGALKGIFTDADLRRRLANTPDLLTTPIESAMTVDPKYIDQDALASEALALMNRHRIDELPVVDSRKRPVGLIDVQDLVALRIVE